MKKAARSGGEGGRGDGHSADDEARVRKLFHPGGKVLFKCLKKPNFDYQMNVYQKMLSIISFIPHNLNIYVENCSKLPTRVSSVRKPL